MPFVINRIPSEEFGIAVHGVGILTRTGTHLKLIRSCHNCNRQVADHFHPQIGGGHFFFSAFGRTPPLLPLVRDPHPTTPLFTTEHDGKKTLGPIVIWIATHPGTTTTQNACDSSPDILHILEDNGVNGAVVEWYEGSVERLAG